MATISSAGIGSGLDVNSIVSQLVALEKQPLKTLEIKAKTVTAQVSAFGQIQSQFAALSDVATRISATTGWSTRTGSSSNSAAASITASTTAAATSFTLDVDALAKEQSNSSASVALNSLVGAGTLTFRTGTWTGNDSATIAATAALDATAATALSNFNLATAADAAAASATADDAAAASALQDDANAAAAGAADANEITTFNALALANANLLSDPGNPGYIAAQSAAQIAYDDAVVLAAATDAAALTATADLTDAAALSVTADLTDAAALTATANLTDAVALGVTSTNAANAASAATRPSFSAGSGTSDITVVTDASDTVTSLAAKINAASAGVVATVFRDGSGERLLLRSKDTGAASGFRVQATLDGAGTTTDNLGLSRFAYDPQAGAFGLASSGIPVQVGQDARARINGLDVTSKSNTLADNIPGVTINLIGVTTSSATMSIREDVTPAVKNVQDFVTAYNALNQTLADLTKYDAATKTSSLFQADSSIVGLQNILRGMAGSVSNGSTYQRLSDVGIQRQLDGSLAINTSKLATAANNGTELQKLFTTNNSNPNTNGFAVKFADLGKAVLGIGGAVTNKAVALQGALKRNSEEQTRVTDRAAAFEARVRKQYSALDARMASLSALNSYVAQQVTTWNKSTG